MTPLDGFLDVFLRGAVDSPLLNLVHTSDVLNVTNDIYSHNIWIVYVFILRLLSGVVRFLPMGVAPAIRNRTTDGGYLAAVTPHTAVSRYAVRLMAGRFYT